MTFLEFNKVSRHFGKVTALKDFSMVCSGGSALCLIGPNGAGKSTALSLAAGLQIPSSGNFHWSTVSGDKALFGYLPQESRFPGSLTVEETLRFCASAREADSGQWNEAVEITGLKPVLERFVGELSGGWVQRLGLAWALMPPSDFYLLDEPFVGLDPVTLKRILSYLQHRLSQGAGILMASHEFEIVDSLSPRVAVLEEGRVVGLTDGPCSGARSFYEKTFETYPPAAVRRIS